MKTICLLCAFLITVNLSAADLPTGQQSPEGVACDAVMAYINRDSKAWLATLVRPIYGKTNDLEYAKFKDFMTAKTDKMKEDKDYKPPRLIKCYKARPLSANGPHSAAFAIQSITENMFVDIVFANPGGELQSLRYHVLKDKDGKWYFEPRPDLCWLFSMGINEETESTELLYEAK